MCPQRDKLRQIETSKDCNKTDEEKNLEHWFKLIIQFVLKGVKSFEQKILKPDFIQDEDDSSNQEFHQNPSKDIDYKYSRDSNQPSGSSHSINRQTTYDQPRITAELCLIVPARLVSNLTPPQTLTREEICHLIDNCAYFRCLPSKDLGSLEQDLQPTSEPILPDSERDVYIRIQIEDGENMIDNPSCYGLKKRLPQTGTPVIQECKLLANLSGRQHFNRI